MARGMLAVRNHLKSSSVDYLNIYFTEYNLQLIEMIKAGAKLLLL